MAEPGARTTATVTKSDGAETPPAAASVPVDQGSMPLPEARPTDVNAGDGSPSRRRAVVIAALLCALVAAGTFSVMQTSAWWSHRGLEQDRRQAISLAEDVTLAMSNMDFKNPDSKIAELLKMTTGELQTTVRTNRSTQEKIAQQFQVHSTAKVEAAGIVRQSKGSAVVAVALSSKVLKVKDTQPQDHWFRVNVTVEKQPDGHWLASKVEFVQ